MNKKIILLSLISAFTISSCAHDYTFSSSIDSSLESSVDSSTSLFEPADPNGFDPNFNYVGFETNKFEIIAGQYVANAQFKPEQARDSGFYLSIINNYGVITFPFRDTSIVAFHYDGYITEVHRFKSEKLTLSKANNLGTFTDKLLARSTVSYFRGDKTSYTKWLNCQYIFNADGHPDDNERYLKFFKDYGIPTSMFVYYDSYTDENHEKQVGRYYLGLVIESASAIPVYSEDLTEIIGVMTLCLERGRLRRLVLYLKEDGFDNIVTVETIVALLSDHEVETILNPCFYITDTSTLPKGDWRVILSNSAQTVRI
ncbi:MAG: hypothetical protein GX813_01080 [Erysipelotrichia bacterium]|nr:hypothetical protein [Erysipelotrichia bacterium]